MKKKDGSINSNRSKSPLMIDSNENENGEFLKKRKRKEYI